MQFLITTLQYRPREITAPVTYFYLIPMVTDTQNQDILTQVRHLGGEYSEAITTDIPKIVKQLAYGSKKWEQFRVNVPIRLIQGCINEVIQIIYVSC